MEHLLDPLAGPAISRVFRPKTHMFPENLYPSFRTNVTPLPYVRQVAALTTGNTQKTVPQARALGPAPNRWLAIAGKDPR